MAPVTSYRKAGFGACQAFQAGRVNERFVTISAGFVRISVENVSIRASDPINPAFRLTTKTTTVAAKAPRP